MVFTVLVVTGQYYTWSVISIRIGNQHDELAQLIKLRLPSYRCARLYTNILRKIRNWPCTRCGESCGVTVSNRLLKISGIYVRSHAITFCGCVNIWGPAWRHQRRFHDRYSPSASYTTHYKRALAATLVAHALVAHTRRKLTTWR